jgi:hypothetical protein
MKWIVETSDSNKWIVETNLKNSRSTCVTNLGILMRGNDEHLKFLTFENEHIIIKWYQQLGLINSNGPTSPLKVLFKIKFIMDFDLPILF